MLPEWDIIRGETMNKKKTWIVVAHRGGAKIYQNSGIGKGIEMIEGLVNPAGMLKNQQIDSDKPGRTYASSVGGGRHSVEPEESAHEHALTTFVKVLGKKLDKEGLQGLYDELVVVAEPHMLGKLRGEFTKNVERRVRSSINRDLFHSPDSVLVEHLGEVMPL